ncbi:hypothetical protein ACFU99_14195 [Streptomyces sp. NPDC057654]
MTLADFIWRPSRDENGQPRTTLAQGGKATGSAFEAGEDLFGA